jgi:Sensors of blue-light using FAD
MELVHCIYCSASTAGDLNPAQLSVLLDKCRSSNAKREVTGMLLYQHRSFFQVLEGDRSTIENLFEKISADPRHERVIKVIQEPIAERAFASWSMVYPRITTKKLAKIPGLNDFFGSANSYLELGQGRAKTLLAAFKEGKWRASLS